MANGEIASIVHYVKIESNHSDFTILQLCCRAHLQGGRVASSTFD